MRLRQGLIKRVELRTAPGVYQERHATWLELFYDLAFVAAITQLSTALATDFSWSGVARFFALFVTLWWAWVGQTIYLSRFDSDDLVHRVLAFMQIMIVALISVNIPYAFEGHPQGFALAYAAIRFILIAQYFVAGLQIKKARALTTRYAVGFGIAMLIWIWSALIPAPWNMALWAVAIAIEFATPLTCPQLSIDIPPDYSHLPERFGLFTIIVLGEAILAAIGGLRVETIGRDASTVGFLGLVLSFAIWWIYFDGVKGQQVKIPERTKDVKRLMFWLYSHMPLAGGIVLAAVAVKHAMRSPDGEPMKAEEATIFVAGVLLVFLSLHAIYWAGLNPKLVKIAHRLSWPNYATTFVNVPVLFISPQMTGLTAVGFLTTIAVVQVFWTFRELPEMEDLLRKVESAKRQTASSV